MFIVIFVILGIIGLASIWNPSTDDPYPGKHPIEVDQPDTNNNRGCIILVAVGIIFMIVWGTCSDSNKTPEDKEEQRENRKEYDESVSAYVYAKEFVSQRLVSPSTAVFAEMPDCTVSRIRQNLYRVSGYLDAENRYGAMVRMTYICDVRVLADKGQCENIKIIER